MRAPKRKRAAGQAPWRCWRCSALSASSPSLVEQALLLLPFGLVLVALLASTLLAQRSLSLHVAGVADALEEGGVDAGRMAVAQIVGRDTAELDEAGVARAAIESLAENFSDGVVAPTIFMLIAGLPGAAVYKAINTADSMIGHRSERHRDFGRTAAQLDDFLNLPASRLSALLIVAAAAMSKNASAAAAWAATWRDGPKHISPNAGYPEAAMAGALGLALGGPRAYEGAEVRRRVDGRWAARGGRSRYPRGARPLRPRRWAADRHRCRSRRAHRASLSSRSRSICAARWAASRVERRIDQRVVSDAGASRREAGEPGGALAVVGKQPVNVSARDPA